MTTINWLYTAFDAPAGTVPVSVTVTLVNADPLGNNPAAQTLPSGTLTTDVTVDAGTYTITVQDVDANGVPAGPAAVAQLVQGTAGTVSIQVPTSVTTI